MNRKNRMARLASSASVQFNTFLYFQSKQGETASAMIMRITQGGVYVMVKEYGIEGLLTSDQPISCNPEKETAVIGGKVLKVFERVNVLIRAEVVEFRRSVTLVYSP